ncbi:alkaline phosphatase family protein [Arthroderma uncinatum]|uniref:alkaline phosphatase family protein n=1 Tax=Arthroderma uncinatum TaxID=74035 RepID=UPI00144AC951|nr:alkaline phosphatase family protein [Arthroderma uncinatum]KAF3479479.1 alkaline phosphatase family protein [Arthroderma uncinatum]
MPPILSNRRDSLRPRVICYYQTYFPDNGTNYVSMLPLCTNYSGVSHVILAAFHINEDAESITLNDDSPDDPRYLPLWEEVRVLKAAGIKIMGMLGGAAKGSFQRLDGEIHDFYNYYTPLRNMIRAHGLDGLDLDVEEEMSLPGIVRLINSLKSDFGNDFIITLAPVATALIQGLRHLSGFDYFALEEQMGSKISWYHAQFYNGWGGITDPSMYHTIIANGWNPEKVVVGVLSNPRNGTQGYVPMETLNRVLPTLLQNYPSFGGVSGWEYFNALPGGRQEPWQWAALMSLILGMKSLYEAGLPPKHFTTGHETSSRHSLTAPSSGQSLDDEIADMQKYQEILITACSVVIRLISFIFLRWIPAHHAPPIAVSTLCVYLSLIWASSTTSPSDRPLEDSRDKQRTATAGTRQPAAKGAPQKRQRRGVSALWSLISGVPCTNSKLVSWITVGVNVLLNIFVLDFVFRGSVLHDPANLSFSRVGYVSQDSAKILIREPDEGNLPLHVYHRMKHDPENELWTVTATIHTLNDTTDYTFPLLIDELEPATRYQYLISNNLSGEFTTAPAPGSLESTRLNFWTTSCIKAGFPYNPLSHPLRIPGIETLSQVYSKIDQLAIPSFMLFLGDFIYVDVPVRFGSAIKHYRDEYQKVYASPSWHVGEHPPIDLPWIHMLDDHEIANDWHDGNVTEPYPAAIDPYLHYHVSVNPPKAQSPHAIHENTTYFSFTRGPASFFILDARTYRSAPGSTNSTMLGYAQLQSLLDYISCPEPAGVKWKIISSSVPFTKNWHIGTSDTWGGYLNERQVLLEAMWRAERTLGIRIVLLSGDRHEFAATKFPNPHTRSIDPTVESPAMDVGQGIYEFCAGPLSQFYLPSRPYYQTDDEDIPIKYIPNGNFKFGAVDIETRPDGESVLIYTLYVSAEAVWQYKLSVPQNTEKGEVEFPDGEVLLDIVDLPNGQLSEVSRLFWVGLGWGSMQFKALLRGLGGFILKGERLDE